MTIGVRRVVVASFTLPDTNTNAVNLTPDVGATYGYLKARSSNAAAIFLCRDSDCSNEPRFSLAAGETLPIPYEQEAGWFADGSASDVLEFVGDAPE
jgi:hypothetical protein